MQPIDIVGSPAMGKVLQVITVLNSNSRFVADQHGIELDQRGINGSRSEL
jgi:hypothetical protein